MKFVYPVVAGILSVALAMFVLKHNYPDELVHQFAGTLSVTLLGFVLYRLSDGLWKEEKKWAKLG